MSRIVFLLTSFVLAVHPTCAREAVEIMRCQGSAGWTYYLPGGMVPTVGWDKDKIEKSKIRLMYDGKNFDIRFVDSTGKEKSAIKQGAFVRKVSGTDKDITLIVVIYIGWGIVEHYLFHHPPKEDWSVAWGTVKADVLSRRSSVYSAKCE